jgi:hypothetical protein
MPYGATLAEMQRQPWGDLSVLDEVGRTHCGLKLWLCTCSCGHKALRTTTRLRRAVKDGQTSMCLECLRELRSGLHIEYVDRRRQFFRQIWDKFHTLYLDVHLRKMELDIYEESELPYQDHDVPNTDVPIGYHVYEPPDRSPRTPAFEMTLDELGAHFQVSRERARQMERKALRMLRHPSRAKFLRQFVYDSEFFSPPLQAQPRKSPQMATAATPRLHWTDQHDQALRRAQDAAYHGETLHEQQQRSEIEQEAKIEKRHRQQEQRALQSIERERVRLEKERSQLDRGLATVSVMFSCSCSSQSELQFTCAELLTLERQLDPRLVLSAKTMCETLHTWSLVRRPDLDHSRFGATGLCGYCFRSGVIALSHDDIRIGLERARAQDLLPPDTEAQLRLLLDDYCLRHGVPTLEIA